jgi:hypothetical protein
MRMQFVLGIKGKDSIEKKFEKAIKENKNIHMQLIQAFSQAVLVSLNLKEDDDVTVESFRAEMIIYRKTPSEVDIKKEVDN